ncbi:MAG: hypothetical protein JF593_02450 [Novosphingobium sp.]|nr:hypothetical protein [Novosphingobium sp.]
MRALDTRDRVHRSLFVATILTGSFLLFLVQPMVARMALPRLGGAPNVWNSAMLVYQALLLGGYFYAHLLGRLPLRRQAVVHLELLLIASVTLPIGLVALPPPRQGMEVLWVPLLLVLSIGPVFLLVSAQAPLMQRWFTANPAAGEPWALYAASNLGSFAGLMAYPLVAEPLLSLRTQSWAWSAGYALLIALIVLAARARWHSAIAQPHSSAEPGTSIPARQVLLWLALAAVPSGLMLSTTTHLTTDIFAMPLLWVIPLGLYLLSFVVAFAENRGVAWGIGLTAPSVVLLAGGFAMTARSSATMAPVLASIVLLFVVAVTLHSRLYSLRPPAARLTLFYLVASAGGALGGAFTALVAPVAFDWVWEHPILVFAAAALLPREPILDWRRLPGLEPEVARVAAGVFFLFAAALCWLLWGAADAAEPGADRIWLTMAVALCGLALLPWRPLFLATLAMLMLVQGGVETFEDSLAGIRTRSYFGIYTVRDYRESKVRTLAHGTTLHGEQSLDPAWRHVPISYYGPNSGAGLVFGNAPLLFGPQARIGVLGLGAGTLACFHRPGQRWTFFEIDRTVFQFSRQGTFTYVRDCAPDARVVLGDARLALARMLPASLDLLAMDAFSSDSIPLHLVTDEAFGVYLRDLAPKGVLLVHISNRYLDLEPVLAAEARRRGLIAAIRDDNPQGNDLFTASSWVLFTRDPAQLRTLEQRFPASPWLPLRRIAPRPWTDDHASILPYIRWGNLLGHQHSQQETR